MAYLILLLTTISHILQSTDCHITREITKRNEKTIRSSSFNLEDETHKDGQFGHIDKPIINIQDLLNSFNNQVDDKSSFKAVFKEQHGTRLTRSPKKEKEKTISKGVKTTSKGVKTSSKGVKTTSKGVKTTSKSVKTKKKKIKKDDELECYYKEENTTDEGYLVESEHWKTCVKITTTTLFSQGDKLRLNKTSVVRKGIPHKVDRGCSTNRGTEGVVVETCYCSWDGCNPANNQAIFSSILLMFPAVVILLTQMLHTRFV